MQHDELVNLPSRTAPFPKRKRALWSCDTGGSEPPSFGGFEKKAMFLSIRDCGDSQHDS